MIAAIDPAGVAVFIAVISAIVALANDSPGQWGVRRITFGIGVMSAAAAGLLLSHSPGWWVAVVFGAYQVYVGGSFVAPPPPVTAESFEYLPSTAKVLSYVALADGPMTSAEIMLITGYFEGAGFTPQLRDVKTAIFDCEQELRSSTDRERLFTSLQDACAAVCRHTNRQTRVELLQTAAVIAGNSGNANADQNRALELSASWLGLSSEDLEGARARG